MGHFHAYHHRVPGLSLHLSDAGAGSEDGITLGVASAKPEADTHPHGPGSSSEQQNRSQHTGTETETGLDQGVGQHNVPLVVQQVLRGGGDNHFLFNNFSHFESISLVIVHFARDDRRLSIVEPRRGIRRWGFDGVGLTYL